jgi:Ca2+/Na+ antiporter
MVRHFAEYTWSLRNEFLAIPNLAGSVVLTLLGLLGLVGYVATVRRGITILEVFVPAYVILIALWTSDQDLRFLLPIIPLWLLYVSTAIVWLSDYGGRRLSRSVGIALALMVAVSYTNYFARASYRRNSNGTNDAGFQSVYEFVRDKTPRNGVILFSKPRLLALLTCRKSSIYPAGTATEIVSYGRQIGAEYVIAADAFENDRRILLPAVAGHPNLFEPIFRSGGFAVYQIRVGH